MVWAVVNRFYKGDRVRSRRRGKGEKEVSGGLGVKCESGKGRRGIDEMSDEG